VDYPILSVADAHFLIAGYERGKIEGFRAGLRLLEKRFPDFEPRAIALVGVGVLMRHLKSQKHGTAMVARPH
jgi:hypothetical protein